jgi:hypothetical protein
MRWELPGGNKAEIAPRLDACSPPVRFCGLVSKGSLANAAREEQVAAHREARIRVAPMHVGSEGAAMPSSPTEVLP